MSAQSRELDRMLDAQYRASHGIDETRDAEIANRILEVVASADFGAAGAAKRGRDPRWPYVPIIDHSEPCGGGVRQRTEQILGLAYETRAEAIEAAVRAIQARRFDLATKLANQRYRALREQYGLPRELEDVR